MGRERADQSARRLRTESLIGHTFLPQSLPELCGLVGTGAIQASPIQRVFEQWDHFGCIPGSGERALLPLACLLLAEAEYIGTGQLSTSLYHCMQALLGLYLCAPP